MLKTVWPWLFAVSYLVISGIVFSTSDSLIGETQFWTYSSDATVVQWIVATFISSAWGLTAAVLTMAIAVPVGVFIGYSQNLVASLISSAVDIIGAVPRYILVLFLFSMYGKDIGTLTIGCAIACIPQIAETIRSHIASQMQQGRFAAFLAHGLPPTRILGFHFLVIGARQKLIREFLSIIVLFFVTEASLAYIDPYAFQNTSATWGIVLSRLTHGGHMATAQGWATVSWFCVVLVAISGIRHQMRQA